MTAETIAQARVVRFSVNGYPVRIAAPGGRRLLDVLREDLGLTGTKEGCGEGECGACSVLVDGALVNSCLVPVCQVDGCEILTIEGLADDERLDPLQSAFVETGAAQCGFCTPGMLLAGRSFLDSGEPATEEAIREAIAGNLCRCTGYTKIVEAIERAAQSGHAGGEARPIESLGLGGALRAADTLRAAGSIPPGEAPPAGGQPASGVALDRSREISVILAEPGGLPVESPRALPEALQILAARPCRPIAGGTDLMVALASRNGEAAGTAAEGLPLLDLSRLDELRGIRLETRGGGPLLVLGTLTTFAELRRSQIVTAHLPVLAEVAATIGAVQIQNRGTIGGNIANASPAGDTLPLLLATDAEIVLGSVDGERRVPAAAFFTAYRTTARSPRELILRVEIPLRAGREVRFRKVGTRRALAISKVVMAVSWRDGSAEDGRSPWSGGESGQSAWHDVRVAVGSVAPVPMRASRTEAIIEGAVPSLETADRAAEAIAAEVTPIDDVRSTAEYRRAVTARILRRIIREAGGWQGHVGTMN